MIERILELYGVVSLFGMIAFLGFGWAYRRREALWSNSRTSFWTRSSLRWSSSRMQSGRGAPLSTDCGLSKSASFWPRFCSASAPSLAGCAHSHRPASPIALW